MRRDQRQTAARVAGLAGCLLVAVSVAGLATTQLTGGPSQPKLTPKPASAGASGASVSEAPTPVAAAASRVPVAAVAPAAALPAVQTIPAAAAVPSADPRLYPLQVGRYWVYQLREPDSDGVTVVERAIVRRQVRDDGVALYIFDDGGVVYFEGGRVYEMGSQGGVNIIPVDVEAGGPVVYRSQGLQIEKWVGAADTSLVVDGTRFDGCLEVVTRFRDLDAGTGAGGSVSFSSFYAPGIGMVGRQTWPRDDRGSLAVTLADHGTRHL